MANMLCTAKVHFFNCVTLCQILIHCFKIFQGGHLIQVFLNISAGRLLLLLEQIRNKISTMYIFVTVSFLRCLGEGTKFGRDTHTETRMEGNF